MKGSFDEHGIPEALISDGETQYSSREFKKFSESYGFRHTFSSPHYPRSNRLSERTVQTAKNLLQKCLESGADPHLAMICHRATPVDHKLPSPAEMLNSRKYKTNLPAKSRHTEGNINVQLQAHQDEQKRHHDKSATTLPDMMEDDCIRAFNLGTRLWEPAMVLHYTITPRSSVIKTEIGAVYRRNRRHLWKTGEVFPPFQHQSPDEPVNDESDYLHHVRQ